jgi:hypothetical protein
MQSDGSQMMNIVLKGRVTPAQNRKVTTKTGIKDAKTFNLVNSALYKVLSLKTSIFFEVISINGSL